MTSTFRKRLGPMSVVATIAVLGLLAAFIALGAMPGITFAQDDGGGTTTPPPPPPPPPPPDPNTGGGDTPPPPPPPPDPSTGGGDTPRRRRRLRSLRCNSRLSAVRQAPTSWRVRVS